MKYILGKKKKKKKSEDDAAQCKIGFDFKMAHLL